MGITLSSVNSRKQKKKSNLANSIQKLREINNITILDFSKKLKISFNNANNYLFDNKLPPLAKILKIADFFGVSADFLLLWDRIRYPRSIRLLSLAEKIDTMDVDKWHKAEATAATFLGNENASKEPEIIFDDPDAELTSSIHKNIRLLRNRVEYSQAKLSRYLSQTASQVSHYETGKSTPPAEKLILMSVLFQTSIHAIATGRKLYFNFRNKDLKDTMLNADYYLDLEKKRFICEMMEKIIEESTSRNPTKTDPPRPLNKAESPSEGS